MIPMGKYRVEYDREGCIGAAACVVVDSKNWVMVDEVDVLRQLGADPLAHVHS